MLRLISLLGVFALLGLCYAMSTNRRAVSWRLVLMGLLIQGVLGGAFLYWETGNRWLQSVGQGVKGFLDLAQSGTSFVFGDLANASDRDLVLYRSVNGVHFQKEGQLFVSEASSPTVIRAADDRLIAVFRWPAADLPESPGRFAVCFHDGERWSPAQPVVLDGLPEGLQHPFDPCLVQLPDGRFRLYFSASLGHTGKPAVYSAMSDDATKFVFEPGLRFGAENQVVSRVSTARLGGSWHLLAPLRTSPGTAYHATSLDGLQFSREPDVTFDGAGPWLGSLLADGDALRFFGGGWSARSSDGATWMPESRLVGSGVNPAVARAADGSYTMIAPGDRGYGFIFATQVLPTLIFFSAFMAVLYHLGVMQIIVSAMAVVMAKLLGTSGSESLSACGNVFVGQTEAPLMVRPFLPRMTMSEIHAIMTGGFATIAGGVFALYVGFGIEPGHLMVASVMAVPAGLVCSKILWPETEESETMGRVVMSKEKTAGNVVEAAATGALDGLKLALNVGAMLVAFLGLVAVLDWMLGHVGGVIDVPGLSVGWLLGWLFSPVAAVMGVPAGEIRSLGELLGTKIALTELVAYQELGSMKDAGMLSPRTVMIASFALCGFANFGSMAIQIGGLGAMAPDRKGDLSRIALRAMLAGAIATCVTACVAGVLGSE